MKKIMFGMFLAVIVLFSLSASSWAQGLEDLRNDESLVDFNVIYGEVLYVDFENKTISLEAFDYADEKEIEVVYHITDTTELEGADSLTSIDIGSWIDIEFHTDEEDRKIADFISLELDFMPAETAEELLAGEEF